MREGSREAVDPHDDQRVAFADSFQHPRKHRSRTIAARGLFFMDLGATRGFKGLRLGQGGLILG
jgi:6-phosphogluconate dehydrogenase (decarboxylating)